MRATRRDKSQSGPFQEKFFKIRKFSRDPSQVVGRTPQDTPVPCYTRTSPWPSFFFCESIRANRRKSRCESPGHLSSSANFESGARHVEHGPFQWNSYRTVLGIRSGTHPGLASPIRLQRGWVVTREMPLPKF